MAKKKRAGNFETRTTITDSLLTAICVFVVEKCRTSKPNAFFLHNSEPILEVNNLLEKRQAEDF